MIPEIATVLGYGVLFLAALCCLIAILMLAAWIIGRILRKLKMFWQIAWMVGHYKTVKSAIEALPRNGNHIRDIAVFEQARRVDEGPSNPRVDLAGASPAQVRRVDGPALGAK